MGGRHAFAAQQSGRQRRLRTNGSKFARVPGQQREPGAQQPRIADLLGGQQSDERYQAAQPSSWSNYPSQQEASPRGFQAGRWRLPLYALFCRQSLLSWEAACINQACDLDDVNNKIDDSAWRRVLGDREETAIGKAGATCARYAQPRKHEYAFAEAKE